jgi:hypothetical protein
MFMLAAARDGSGRSDGTPAAFRFNCNFRPELRGNLAVADTLTAVDPDIGVEPCQVIYWISYDKEDGQTNLAKVTLDGRKTDTVVGQQFHIVPNRVFEPTNPHTAKVKVIDRAGLESTESLTISFDVP